MTVLNHLKNIIDVNNYTFCEKDVYFTNIYIHIDALALMPKKMLNGLKRSDKQIGQLLDD